jgi:hypothetical protein
MTLSLSKEFELAKISQDIDALSLEELRPLAKQIVALYLMQTQVVTDILKMSPPSFEPPVIG